MKSIRGKWEKDANFKKNGTLTKLYLEKPSISVILLKFLNTNHKFS